MNEIIVDMFCGAGGTSTGISKALNELNINHKLIAINHWEVAIATHTANHPNAIHYNDSLFDLEPITVVPEKRVFLLSASPECTHHSNAAGGKPKNEQSRSTANCVIKWITQLDIRNIMVENVREITTWGPLIQKIDKNGEPVFQKNGEPYMIPDKNRNGEYFKKWLNKIKKIYPYVEYRILNCADYGDPTTRKRFFLLASKDHPITWPEPKYAGKWVPARDIIDFNDLGTSIFDRKIPLCENTMKRIEYGLKKFCSEELQPFIVKMFGTGKAVSIDKLLDTVTTSGGSHLYLAQPFIVEGSNASCGDRLVADVNKPLKTVLTKDHMYLAQPSFVVIQKGKSKAKSIEKPLNTLTSMQNMYIANPFLIKYHKTGKNVSSVDKPLSTITTKDRLGLVNCCLIPQHRGSKKQLRTLSVEQPLPTTTSTGSDGIATISGTLKDGEIYFDVFYRMLKPSELAAGMSFKPDYKFKGTKTEIVKQIGNAVPGKTAAALAYELAKKYPECDEIAV